MPTDPSASQTTRALERKKGMDIERAFQSALGVYQGALSTKPAGITQ